MTHTRSDSEVGLRRIAQIPSGRVALDAELEVPAGAAGLVLFAHGGGSSRFSPHDRHVAQSLRDARLGTLLFDLLTPEEAAADQQLGHLRFNVGLLADRLVAAAKWAGRQEETAELNVGYFAADTAAGAALVAAARLGEGVGAVVARGGRVDLTGSALPHVTAPTLLIVGGLDAPAVELNEAAYARLECEKELQVVPGAGRLFEEPGALEAVAPLAAGWFARHLRAR